MSTNFPGPPHTDGFCWIFCVMGNWWENPCISHVRKCTAEWESNGKKAPKLWENYEYQLPRSSSYNGFCCIFPYYGKLMGKPMHFPYDEVYHRMGIGWKRSTHTITKYDYQFPRFSPYNGFCCIFPYYGKLMGKRMHFPYDEVYHRMRIRWEKSSYTMGKVWLPISQLLSIQWVLLHFPMLWEIDGKSHVFPIWWDSLFFSCYGVFCRNS